MDEKDTRIIALCKRNDELEKDKLDLIKHLESLSELTLKTYKRDATCPYCLRRLAEMEERRGCF